VGSTARYCCDGYGRNGCHHVIAHKTTGTEKAIWMLIISALVVIEITPINRDRFSNEQTEKIRAEEERQHFTTIGKGIEKNRRAKPKTV
jgi:hypothetical protein